MTYLSKGVLAKAQNDGLDRVSCCGRIYVLGPALARLWKKARYVPQPVPSGCEKAVLRLERSGIASVTVKSGCLADYRLLTGCILCPEKRRFFDHFLPHTARRLWLWINGAGLRLTASELVRLEELRLSPVPALLGAEGRMRLTEMIYRADTVQSPVLDNAMEQSPARDRTVKALLTLLRTKRLFLL